MIVTLYCLCVFLFLVWVLSRLELYAATSPRKIEWDYPIVDSTANRYIVLKTDCKGYPFNGEDVLIYITGRGWAEAWWAKEEPGRATPNGPAESDGFYWVVLDDAYGPVALEDATHWLPLPAEPKKER